jgi:flavin reductase (DIM6/NTAB) family NADH-FMN oxidoreductase RutF
MPSFDPKKIPMPQLHQLLLGAVSPRPIAFASTMDEEGNANLAPYSFFNVFSANPPIAIFSPARRGRDNTTKHTYQNVKVVKECVINIVNYAMVQQVSLASTEYPKGVNEFVKTGLTPLPSEMVKPFRVKESPVQLECSVREVIELGNEGGAGNLIVCEVLLIHVNDEVLDADGRISPLKMDQVARLGGHWYTRAIKGLFELPQPTTQIGIGFDQLPKDVLHSAVLTGNDLAQLAGVVAIPDETTVNEHKLIELADIFLALEGNALELEKTLHQRAKALIEEKKIAEAWMTLLSFNN